MRRRQTYAALTAAIGAAKSTSPPIRPHKGKYIIYAHPSHSKEEVVEAMLNAEIAVAEFKRARKANRRKPKVVAQ